MAMIFRTTAADGKVTAQNVFPDIDGTTPFYVFRNPAGLLNATHFTQPAITLMSIARYRDMREKGIIQEGSSFAGHSLGEYSALATLGQLMSVEDLMRVVFFRGLTMRLVVDYDSAGRSEYSMCAINPSKVGRGFGATELQSVVATISRESGWLLETVNFNIEGLQYVCAGSLRALHCLSHVLEAARSQSGHDSSSDESYTAMIPQFVSSSAGLELRAIEIPKTASSTPLRGIDVPFHSSLLRSGVDAYREFLKDNLQKPYVQPDLLIGKWISNVTGNPFGISKNDFVAAYEVTQSPMLKEILDSWVDEKDAR